MYMSNLIEFGTDFFFLIFVEAECLIGVPVLLHRTNIVPYTFEETVEPK